MGIIPRRLLRAGSLTLILLAAAPQAAATPGDLDATFGIAGVVITQVGTAFSGASVILLQPDGKLVAVGQSGTPANITLIRYNTDGSVDGTFGGAGVVVTPLGTEGAIPSAAVLQQDGRILVAGATSQSSPQGGNAPLILLRYLPNGSLDLQFGTRGMVTYPAANGLFNQYFNAYSLVLEPDGKAVVSGTSSFGAPARPAGVLVRFNGDGSPDSTFGSGGVQLTDPALGGVAAVQPDGKLLVTGQVCQVSCGSDYLIERFNLLGGIDKTFGVQGIAPFAVSPPADFPGFSTYEVDAIVVQPDGKILLSSRGALLGGRLALPQDVLVATRLNPNGSVDSQFAGGQGVVVAIGDTLPPLGTNDPFAGVTTRLALQGDGKVILVGQPWDRATAAFHLGAVRLNTNGTLDTGYGNAGIVIGPSGASESALIQSDDKLVIGGSNSGFTLARFLPDTGPSIALMTSLNPSPVGQAVTFTATIIGEGPTGAVQFRDGPAPISGCAAAPLNVGAQASVANCTTAALGVGAHVVNAAYTGDGGNAPGVSPTLIQVVSTPGTDIAVEYQYAPWNHFFITSLPNEIAALDGGAFGGWQRTGESFAVYPDGAPQSVAQCRFFSGTSFAPKSSHFYTPYPFECDFVRQTESGIWGFEGDVMSVQLPDAAGDCAVGSRPLYRLFNNGQGGAPNHRYTTSLVTRSSMISQGWIPEGAGPIGVIACVPGTS